MEITFPLLGISKYHTWGSRQLLPTSPILPWQIAKPGVLWHSLTFKCSQTLWSSHKPPTNTALRNLSEQSTPCSPRPSVAQAQQDETKRASCLQKPWLLTKGGVLVLTHESAPFYTKHNLLIPVISSLISNVFSLLLVCLTLSSHLTDGCTTKLLSHSHCLWITLSPRPQTHYNYSAWGCQDNPCSLFILLSPLTFSCCCPASHELLYCFLTTKTITSFCCVQFGSL